MPTICTINPDYRSTYIGLHTHMHAHALPHTHTHTHTDFPIIMFHALNTIRICNKDNLNYKKDNPDRYIIHSLCTYERERK